MDLPARRQAPTVRLRRLAAELRALREAAGLNREEAAEQMRMNPSSLYRIEHAKGRPQRRTLETLLDHYGVTDPHQREALAELSKNSTQLGWLQEYEGELPEEYQTYISFEAEAGSVRNNEPLFVPGLLQTEEYARALVAGVLPHVSGEEVERRVQARLRRQSAITTRSEPLKLWAILDEAVLRRDVGGREVMAGQLRRLVEASRQPHVTIQVMPYRMGAHPGMHSAFALMDFPDPADPELVYVESTALFLERPAEVKRYADVFDYLRAAAMSPRDSIVLIDEIAG